MRWAHDFRGRLPYGPPAGALRSDQNQIEIGNVGDQELECTQQRSEILARLTTANKQQVGLTYAKVRQHGFDIVATDSALQVGGIDPEWRDMNALRCHAEQTFDFVGGGLGGREDRIGCQHCGLGARHIVPTNGPETSSGCRRKWQSCTVTTWRALRVGSSIGDGECAISTVPASNSIGGQRKRCHRLSTMRTGNRRSILTTLGDEKRARLR